MIIFHISLLKIHVVRRGDSNEYPQHVSLILLAACDETFTDETGVIQSPNYPNAYPNNRECAYVINRPAGERIRLTFSFFDVEGSGCQFDYLEVSE